MADAIDWNLLVAYTGLTALAVGSIYTGAHGSLPPPVTKDSSVKVESSYEDIQVNERVKSSDAWLFPIMGSAVLFGMYTAFKVFGPEWINWFLGWYFAITSVGSTWRSSISFVRYLVGPTRWKQFDSTRLVLWKGTSTLVALSCRTPTLILLPLSTWPSLYYTMSSAGRKSILLTNILSLCFSFNALTIIKLDSFKTGVILLSALLIYDVFWVFKTDVMVSVATNLDIPIKLSWPKDLLSSGKGGYMMLGLGDIVVPGLFVALGLRYDFDRAQKKSPGQGSFSKPYFHTMLLGYFVGLTTTMVVLHVFRAAQPALLYLSPACIISMFLTAVVRGELVDVWSWSDDPYENALKEHANANRSSKTNPTQEQLDSGTQANVSGSIPLAQSVVANNKSGQLRNRQKSPGQ